MKKQSDLSRTPIPLDDELLTAQQVAEILKLTPEAVYQGRGLAKLLHPIKSGKKFTRWSRNELHAVIAEAIQLVQQDNSPAEQTNVYPLRRETKPKAFSRAELVELKTLVKNK